MTDLEKERDEVVREFQQFKMRQEEQDVSAAKSVEELKFLKERTLELESQAHLATEKQSLAESQLDNVKMELEKTVNILAKKDGKIFTT